MSEDMELGCPRFYVLGFEAGSQISDCFLPPKKTVMEVEEAS
jgi:hypothetical protein